MNRMVDAFGADISPSEARTLGAVLDSVGGRVEYVRRAKPWKRLRGVVPAPLQTQLQRIREGEGDCPAPLRSAIEAYVTGRSGGRHEANTDLPPAVLALTDTLVADAHGVTDGHIADLKASRWSEEAIYEMIYVASFAAGLGRVERALHLLSER